MKSEEKDILRKLYEAVCYLNEKNGVDRIKAKKIEESLQKMLEEIEAKKKSIREGLERIQQKVKKIG